MAAGDDLAALTVAALARGGLVLRSDDVLVFAQKVISKAEGRRIDLATVVPGAEALELAQHRAERIPGSSSWCCANRGGWCAPPRMF